MTVSYSLVFAPSGNAAPRPQSLAIARRSRIPPPRQPLADKPKATNPYSGRLATVMGDLQAGHVKRALKVAQAWHAEHHGDVLALIGLGEALEASKQPNWAARAYGSIIDLFPSRADPRRYAGQRLERIKGAAALRLAVDSYRKARAQRPDHPTSHRLLAFALSKQGRHKQAFEVLAEGLAHKYPSRRFAGALSVLREDLGLVAAA